MADEREAHRQETLAQANPVTRLTSRRTFLGVMLGATGFIALKFLPPIPGLRSVIPAAPLARASCHGCSCEINCGYSCMCMICDFGCCGEQCLPPYTFRCWDVARICDVYQIDNFTTECCSTFCYTIVECYIRCCCGCGGFGCVPCGM